MARIAEDEKALPLDHACVALAENRSEFDQMRYRRVGIFIPLVHIDRSPVIAHESFTLSGNPPQLIDMIYILNDFRLAHIRIIDDRQFCIARLTPDFLQTPFLWRNGTIHSYNS